jgi:hypothetical protein
VLIGIILTHQRIHLGKHVVAKFHLLSKTIREGLERTSYKKDEDAETWLLGMRKYFQLHNFSVWVERRIYIYQLKGKASMWWDHFVQVHHIDEKKVTLREFKRYFQMKYLTKRYYDKKMKEFFEINIGSMTIDEYERRFLELLKYVAFIKDEQVKIRRYLSGMPPIINDKIQYDDPKTLDETIRRAKCISDQQRGRSTFQKASENKMKSKMEQRKKEAKPPFFRNTMQGKPTPNDPTMTYIVGKKKETIYSMLGLWQRSYTQRFPLKR